jgi:hypothetical protein
VIRYDSTYTESVKTIAAALPGATLESVPGLGGTIQVIIGSSYSGASKVTVKSDKNSTPGARSAADDLCS